MSGERPVRVLHLLKGLDAGGAERLVLDLCLVADPERVTPSVAGILGRHRALVPALDAAGVVVHELGASSQFDLAWTVALRRLLLSSRPDVLHLHLPYPAVLGRLVARSLPVGRRPAVVHTRHNLWTATHPLLRAADLATASLDDASLVVASSAWAALPQRLRRRTEILPHGVRRTEPDPSSAASSGTLRGAVRAELGARPGEALVLSIANLRAEKGFDVLLPAAAALVAAGCAVRFAAAGDGPLAGALARERDRLALGDHFVFLGYRDDVARLLAGADVLVLASHHEAFPLAVMEALAAGVPVVSTAVGDVPTVVRDGIEGRLVRPGDAAALAAALREVVATPAARQAMAAAAARTGAKFDLRVTARRLEVLYAGLVAGRRDP